MHNNRVINILGIFLKYGVSVMTVYTASTIENALSIPSKNKVSPSKKAQKFGHFI